jgi:hypothetical protein
MNTTRTLAGAMVLAAASTAARAQQPPGTDIWIAPLTVSQGKASLGAPRNLTARTGYDNQPAWSARGDVVYFSSARGDGQNDIWSVEVSSAKQTRITTTNPESEYSPTLMPDGTALSVVRVERDSSQRLWRIPLAGGAESVILANVKPVGYHAWVSPTTLALFVLGSGRGGTPSTLQIANTNAGTATVLAERIGRGLARIPRTGAFSYVDKMIDNEWWIRRIDLETGARAAIARTLPGGEDYAWTPDALLLMARDSLVFQFGTAGWTEIANLGSHGVQNITRMAVSPRGDYLAFVARDRNP